MVASGFVSSLQNLWPFSVWKYDDLRRSSELVGRLSVPESTKNFVFAIRVPENDSVIYILSAQNLSERSARDAECLIKEVRPDAVVVQVDKSAMAESQNEESGLGDGSTDSVPTSAFQVLKQCFVDKVNKENYESVAGILVLREIFGTSFNGHYLAAKRMAEQVGSSFMVLESPFVNISAMDCSSGEFETGNKLQGLANSFLPLYSGSNVLSTSRRSLITNEVQARMLKLLSSHINQLSKEFGPSAGEPNEIQPLENYAVPSFAQSIYPLLVDLHDIFNDLPFIGRALANARKMLSDVNRGEAVDAKIVSEVYIFQIAVEGLRIALNNAGRVPIKNMGSSSLIEVDFSKLSSEDKSYALIADLLKNQAEKFKTIVAIVDASNLAGLRKHWNTCVPREVKDMSGHILTGIDDDDDNKSNNSKLKRLLSDKPVVAVGAGATALWSASSLSKAISASPFMKIVTFKVPSSLNLFLTHTQKVMTLAFSKVMGPSKVMMAPGFASSGAKSTSVLKASLSAEKIRAVTHSLIASVEKTSFSAMRTAFYEIMRKRQARPLRALPLATFGASLATCTGLVVYGDGIECAAGSLPSAPSIANLGRGIQNLREASQVVRQIEGNKIQNSIESLMQRLKKVKIQ
ncbi:PREDICTED: uncharacterized protein LOC104802304 [Tarenaya hassleriana]|uniref:uncharacterized protein LOC104802304 n=1 Tax=Tarenaya hassleriana TaxID=28532 RepID=UPI00053C3124|nr:PREDICTED: uncharacterized protein LOC104802304 [Tarenaya hassleriana]